MDNLRGYDDTPPLSDRNSLSPFSDPELEIDNLIVEAEINLVGHNLQHVAIQDLPTTSKVGSSKSSKPNESSDSHDKCLSKDTKKGYIKIDDRRRSLPLPIVITTSNPINNRKSNSLPNLTTSKTGSNTSSKPIKRNVSLDKFDGNIKIGDCRRSPRLPKVIRTSNTKNNQSYALTNPTTSKPPKSRQPNPATPKAGSSKPSKLIESIFANDENVVKIIKEGDQTVVILKIKEEPYEPPIFRAPDPSIPYAEPSTSTGLTYDDLYPHAALRRNLLLKRKLLLESLTRKSNSSENNSDTE